MREFSPYTIRDRHTGRAVWHGRPALELEQIAQRMAAIKAARLAGHQLVDELVDQLSSGDRRRRNTPIPSIGVFCAVLALVGAILAIEQEHRLAA